METDCQSLRQENQDVVSDPAADEEGEVGVAHVPPVLHILDLPDSVIFQILVYLPFSSIGSIAQVCNRFSRISSDELLWRHVFLQHYKLAGNTVMPTKAKSWRQEFKRLYYHTPAVLSEERKEHKDEVLHVSFSHDGTMFATCSKDGFFKIWECTHPVRLLFKMDMKSTFSWKFTQFSQFNETDTCLLVSGVYFGRLSTSGEIAVFNLQDDFRMQCRVTNKPYDVFGAWYDNDHLLSGTLYWTGDFNSVSAVWLSKASQEVESEVESVSMVLYRFENVNSSSIRLLHVAEVDKDNDATESVMDKEDFDGSESAQTSQHSSSLGFGDEGKISIDSNAANVRPDVEVKGQVDMDVERTCILDRLLQKYIAEDEFDLENEDKTDNEGEGDEFHTDPDIMNQGSGAPVLNPVPVANVVTFRLNEASSDEETDRRPDVETYRSCVSPSKTDRIQGVETYRSCVSLPKTDRIQDVETYRSCVSPPTSAPGQIGDVSDVLANDVGGIEPCLSTAAAEATDFDMESDIAQDSLANTQVGDRIFPEVRKCDCRSGLTSPVKCGTSDAFAEISCSDSIDNITPMLNPPTLPFVLGHVSDNTDSVDNLSVPFPASSKDNPLDWSSNTTENYAKSQSQEFESISQGCEFSLPKSAKFPLFGDLDKRTGLNLQDVATNEKCSVGSLRSSGVLTDPSEINVDFLPDTFMEVIMEDADIIGDHLPPCIIRTVPEIFSLTDDVLIVGSADVHEDSGGTSDECFRHSPDIPLHRDQFQQGTDFEGASDNRHEALGVASALEDKPGAKDASQQFGDVSLPNVPSIFDNSNLVMLIPGASHVYGSRNCGGTNSSNNASCYNASIDVASGSTFEHDTANIDILVREPGTSHNHKSSIATQTEVASSRASSFHSLSHISQSSSLSRDLRFNPPREKLLIYTWGSETYIPHKVGIKRMKWTDFTKGEVTARRSSMLLPDVMENLHNMAGNRRDKPDVTIEMHGHIVGLSLSPDHKYLYVNCRPWPKNYIISDPQESPPLAQEVEISTIDLTTFNFVGPVLRSHKAYTHSDECFFLNLDVSDDYVASGAEDRQGYLWDRHYGIPLYRFPHRNVVNCVAINPQDSEILVTVSDDYTFKVWMSRCRAAELTGSKEAVTGTSV